MEELITQMKRVLADTFVMYMKAHSYHWNVEGHQFTEFHAFFGSLYIELHAAIDPIAENIRTLDSYAPASLSRITELSTISDENTIPSCEMMPIHLLAANKQVIDCIMQARKFAETEQEIAIISFLETRLESHQKHGWMLKAISKKM